MSAALHQAVQRPTVVETRAQLTAALDKVRANGGRIGLVPTMGALHEGHASLVRTARNRLRRPTDALVVSIFVNPLQFGPNEDLARYPRTLETDLEVCAAEGADLVFVPSVDEVYPGGEPQVTVDPGPLAQVLEGRSRPTHFHGVLVVVAKLFGLVRPDLAVFGQKDFQQLVLVRRMAADLCMGVEVVGAETVREEDGLALSSRNRYLDAERRRAAVTLSRALLAGARSGSLGPEQVLAAAAAVLQEQAEGDGGVDLDYLELTAPDLGPPPESGEARLLVAARVGSTRLIDNIAVTLGRTDDNSVGSS